MSDIADYVNGEPEPIKKSSVAIQTLVITDLFNRMEHGMRKYGTYLQANNGRNALQDAYEEALDLAVYLKQALEEQRNEKDTRLPG